MCKPFSRISERTDSEAFNIYNLLNSLLSCIGVRWNGFFLTNLNLLHSKIPNLVWNWPGGSSRTMELTTGDRQIEIQDYLAFIKGELLQYNFVIRRWMKVHNSHRLDRVQSFVIIFVFISNSMVSLEFCNIFFLYEGE